MYDLLNRSLLITFLSFIGGSFLLADQIAVNTFKGLNSNENSTIIDPTEAQDLLNVDVTPGGKSVKKRSGYGLYKLLFSDSAGIRGGYHGFNSTGDDVQIWASSVSVKGIVSDGTPNTIVSSMTVNSTIDCADTQGSIYCVSSNRDFYIRTNGSTLTSWHTSPLGTMIESTPDRIVVAGVSAAPSTLYVSQSNTFTNFTTGVNATDAFTEVIAAPGSRLTHIRWGCQRLLWWKDQSFGYFDFDDQYIAQVSIVSDNIGTLDNTSAVDPGGNVWFRGQDGHTYKYDCSGLEKETIDITPQIQLSGHRTSNSWTQTSQSDFLGGAIVPGNTLSDGDYPGEIVPHSFGTNEQSGASGWSSGTSSNFVIGTSSLSLAVANTNISNNDFESGGSAYWTLSNGSIGGAITGVNCTLTPRSASNMLIDTIASSPVGQTYTVSLKTCVAGTTISSVTFAQADNSCSWTTRTISSSGALKKRIKIVAENTSAGSTVATSACFLNSGTNITLYTASDYTRNTVPTLRTVVFDDVTNGSNTITSGSFTSQSFAMNVASATWQIENFAWTANTSSPTFNLQTASSTSGPWTSLLTASSTNGTGAGYAQYTTTITAGPADDALTAITIVSILSVSSGTFYSAVHNAPNLTVWSAVNMTDAQPGSNSIAYFTRSSTNSFTVLSATPAWTGQAKNSTVVVATGTYFQLRSDFYPISPDIVENLHLYDFTFNWFEGTASDQAYMTYFDNAIWKSVTYGVGISSNNYIFRYDLINDGWGLYYFGAGGMLIQNNHLFFGSVTDGNIFRFGDVTSDNGTEINAYWKSKDFTGSDPFLQNQLTQIDTFAKKNQGQTLTATYALDTSTTTTSYSIVLSSNTQNIIQSRKLLPSGKLGYTFNINYGDNTEGSAWELLGFRMGYIQQPYRPSQ